MKKGCLIIIILFYCITPVLALNEEDLHMVGGDGLVDAVPEEQQKYLNGITINDEISISSFIETFLNNISSDSRNIFSATLKSFTKILLIIIFTASARGIAGASGSSSTNAIIDMAGIIGCAAILTTDFTSVLHVCTKTLDQISLFSGTLQPVLAGVLSVGGHTATASTLQVASMFVFDIVIRIIKTVFVPAV